jgi:hypothetical protein
VRYAVSTTQSRSRKGPDIERTLGIDPMTFALRGRMRRCSTRFGSDD